MDSEILCFIGIGSISNKRVFLRVTPLARYKKLHQAMPAYPNAQPTPLTFRMQKLQNSSISNMLQTNYFDIGPPPPSNNTYIDAWDSSHVKLPCSPKNLFPVAEGSCLTSRWELIETALLRDIKNTKDLEVHLCRLARPVKNWQIEWTKKSQISSLAENSRCTQSSVM